jgi:hypothetical protein
MNINFSLFGDWDRVKRLMNSLPRNLQLISISAQRSVAERYARKVKAHLKNQDIKGWTPLSSKYADKKMAKYGEEDLLIASWDYYNAIKAWRTNKVYSAGVPAGLIYPNGKEIAKIAQIHEAWSYMAGRPHRPLWTYTLNNDMGGLKGMRNTVNKIIRDKLRERGYPVKPLL